MGQERIRELDQIADMMHAGQVDKQGQPYIDHLRAVAGAVSDAAKPAALFHDAIEDERATEEQLEEILTNTELWAVVVLTCEDYQTYEQYIDLLADWHGVTGDMAREVKIADLQHNLGRLTPALEHLRPRYTAALERLGVE